MAKITNQSDITSKYTLPDQTIHDNKSKSNLSTTENMSVSFIKQRTTEHEYAIKGEEILQTLTLTNQSEYEISNILIKEQISTGATFVANSIEIDNVPFQNFNIASGFTLPENLVANQTKIIKFKIKINENFERDVVNLQSKITYDVNERERIEESSNIVSINISTEKLEILKESTKSIVISGDTLTFVNAITNIGTLTNTEIKFIDNLPQEVEFIEGSVKIDEEPQPTFNPINGINLKDLNPGDKVVVKFDVKVK